ncbi:MAG: hypothetical protein ABIR36_08195 [Nitrospiraceae bacterium]
MSSTAKPRNPERQFVRLGLDQKSIWLIRLVLPDGRPEHHRIVAKVDELMALCDRLETQLTTTQTESRRLLEAVLHEALST